MRRAVTAPLLAALMLGLAACSGARVEELAFTDTPPDQLYNEGLVLMNEGDYRTATLKFEEVDRLHPHTQFGRRSQVMMAFANYSQGKYPEAINAARRFITLYPRDEDAAYAQYIIGNSYFKQIPDVTRDQAETRKALDEFRTLIEKYPDSIYVDDAQAKIRAATSSPESRWKSAATIWSATTT